MCLGAPRGMVLAAGGGAVLIVDLCRDGSQKIWRKLVCLVFIWIAVLGVVYFMKIYVKATQYVKRRCVKRDRRFGNGAFWMFRGSPGQEEAAVNRSRRSIAALMETRPDYANLVGDGGDERRVDPEAVRPGQLILVKPEGQGDRSHVPLFPLCFVG